MFLLICNEEDDVCEATCQDFHDFHSHLGCCATSYEQLGNHTYSNTCETTKLVLLTFRIITMYTLYNIHCIKINVDFLLCNVLYVLVNVDIICSLMSILLILKVM